MVIFQAVATKKESLQYFQDMTRGMGMSPVLIAALAAKTERFMEFTEGFKPAAVPGKQAAQPRNDWIA
ncbi:MAG: hypothetical protein WC717_02785 [Candidatus Micrarchaeia archaeon]|jgi:hypothetical protein